MCRVHSEKNTKKCTSWALRVFEQWRTERNGGNEEVCPENLLEEPKSDLLNYWLARFVVEIRREDSKSYPATSIKGVLAGLYWYSYECVPTRVVCPNFMNRRDPCFRDLMGALQVKFRGLREEGVGAIVKHAPVVLPEEEQKFWDTKVFGIDSPVALQRAVFFYVGKVCCLRGGEEQRNLKPSQFVRCASPLGYTYIENGSKNYSGADLATKVYQFMLVLKTNQNV